MQTDTRRNRLAAPALFLPLLLALGGCGLDIDDLADSGPITTVEREIDAFTELEIDSAFDVTIEVGPEPSLEFELGEKLVDRLDIEQRGERLTIGLDGRNFSFDNDLKATITTPDLRWLDANGAVSIDMGEVDLDDLVLFANGASSVHADGSIDRLAAEIDGASSVDFSGVTINGATVDANGASSIDLTGAALVEGELNGASSLDVNDDTITRVGTSGASSIDR